MVSQWPHGIPTQATGEITDFLSLSEAASGRRAMRMRLACRHCEVGVRDVRMVVVNEVLISRMSYSATILYEVLHFNGKRRMPASCKCKHAINYIFFHMSQRG